MPPIPLIILIAVLSPLVILILFAPTRFRFAQEIIVNKPKQEVFQYLKLLKNQDEWSVWARMDPQMNKSYSGTDGHAGFVYSWEGNKKVGKGSQEIMQVEEGKRIEFQLRFEKPFKVTNGAELLVTDLGNGTTKVVWAFFGQSPRPMNMFTLLMKSAILKDFRQGLKNLKENLEK